MPGAGPVSRGIAHHPYPIKKLEELPESLMRLAYNYIQLFEQFDFMIVVPNQSFLKGLFGRRIVPQQALLFYSDGVLHLQDASSADRPGMATWVEAKHICRLCSSLLLLYGKLEIVAERGDALQRIDVEYNTVAHELLKPYIQRLLRHTWEISPETPGGASRSASPDISQLPYKFQSGLRIYALQPEEELLGFVFQAEILEPRLGFFHRKITPNTLLSVTNRQIVLIQEEIASTSNYGWVITHFPLQHISKVQSGSYNERQTIWIEAGSSEKGNSKSIILDSTTAKEWMEMVESLHVLA
jgi:hypothetical protein